MTCGLAPWDLEVFLKLRPGSVDTSVNDQFAARLPFPTLSLEYRT